MLRTLEETVDLTPHEVVLINDASPDETGEFLTTLADKPNYKILRNSQNLGFAASNNKGANAATGDILVFLNNDLELTDNWLTPILDLLATLPKAGAVGNIQRNIQTGLVDHAGIFFDLDGLPTHAHKNRANPPADAWKERNALTAACFAIRRDLFLQLGGFDEAYRNGCEDVDLCMRLRKSGHRLYVSHHSVIRHHISVAPGRNTHNNQNTKRFRKLWSDYSKQFGNVEWPIEYFRRYARFWWKMNPKLFCKALYMIVIRSFRPNSY